MIGEAPFLYYKGSSFGGALISVQEDELRASYFAVDAESRKALADVQTVEEEQLPRIVKTLTKTGGIRTTVKRDGTEFHLTIKVWDGRQGGKPDQGLLFGPGAKYRWFYLHDVPKLGPYESALIPVNKVAQTELEGFIQQLGGMPEDLSGAIIRAIVQDDRHPAATTLTQMSTKFSWAFASLAMVVGLVLGSGGVAAYMKYFSPEAASAHHYVEIDNSLRKLEATLKRSKDPKFDHLYESHLGPFGAANDTPLTIEAEALVVLKLELAKAGVQPAPDFNWTAPANTAAIRQRSKLTRPANNAVMAVACLGIPPAISVTPAECRDVHWDEVPAELGDLEAFAGKSGTAPTDESSSVTTDRLTGTITALKESTITVQDKAGISVEVHLKKGGAIEKQKMVTLSELMPEDTVSIKGSYGPDKKTFEATSIEATPLQMGDINGTVLSVDIAKDFITIKPSGATEAHPIQLLLKNVNVRLAVPSGDGSTTPSARPLPKEDIQVNDTVKVVSPKQKKAGIAAKELQVIQIPKR